MAARIILGIVAGLVLALSLALGSAATWLWSSFVAADGAVRDLGAIESTAPVVVVDVAAVSATVPFAIPGRIELAIDADQPVSVFAGPTAEIDRRVFATGYDVAAFADGSWEVTSVPGVRPPAIEAGAGLAGVSGDPAVLDIASVIPGSLAITRTPGDTSALTLGLRYVVGDAGAIAVLGAVMAGFLLLVALTMLWAAVLGLRSGGRHA